MNVIIRILLGIAVMAAGFLMVWKTVIFQKWVGRIPWAEQKFGGGGTNTFLKLLGAAIIFIGIMIATNIISEILESFAGVFTPGS